MRPENIVITSLCFAAVVVAKPEYRAKIPNGYNVPDPCRPGKIWEAAGHLHPDFGSWYSINPFGYDFLDSLHKWSKTLCSMDSDDDGRSNGEELGDPDCLWAEGLNASTTEGLSHPGICEPVLSAHCKSRNWSLNKHRCPALAKVEEAFPPKNWTYFQDCTCFCSDDNATAETESACGSPPNMSNLTVADMGLSENFVIKRKCTCACDGSEPEDTYY